MEEGRTEHPEKTPDDELQKKPHTKAQKVQAQTETPTRAVALVAG